jgi:SnoaL-like domain
VSIDVEVAKRFDAAVDAAFQTGDRESVSIFFADDIEYTTPHRTLSGLREVREKLRWGGEKDNLDVEFEAGEWQDLGHGHVVRESRMVQRWKETSAVAAIMRVTLDLRIRDGKITRLERVAQPE